MVLSTIYVQTIINAMGTDFLPSLVEKRDNNQAFNQHISQQIELGVLIASIGVIATYILAPYVLRLFYSKEFLPGTYILRWQVLAVFLRVMEYPLGFATTAKGKNLFYLILQSVYICFEFGLLLLFTQLFGFKGLGFCYLSSYSIFLVVRYFSVKHFCGYKFTWLIKKQVLAIVTVLILILLTNHFCNTGISLIVNLTILLLFSWWSYRILTNHMEIYPRQILGVILSRIRK
jgi:O-antigen/teichoic acid export membrane protein